MAELLQWDVEGQKYFYGGVSKTVLFPKASSGYSDGVAWSGMTNIEESPEGGEANEVYADNVVYANIRGREKFNFSMEAYDYPEEFEECDGSARPANGLVIGQQMRKPFGICYRTEIGADDLGDFTKGYQIHLVYGCTADPVSKSHATLNDSPDAETFSWSCKSTPVAISSEYGDFKPVAHLYVDSRTADATKLADLEEIVYGTAATTGTSASPAVPARLPSPDEVLDLFGVQAISG